MTISDELCRCGSGKAYVACCGVFHAGELPSDALLLMRSRYSAYALNLPDYIIATTHPASPQYVDNLLAWKRSIARFAEHSSFQRLEVLDFQERAPLATVSFTVHLTQNGQDATFTERSYFEQFKGRWLYLSGQMTAGSAHDDIVTRPLHMLPLAYYNTAILREKALLVADLTEETAKLITDMIATMDACNGIGLAAPQVHHALRVFVTRAPLEVHPGEFRAGDVKVFINPKLSQPSKETWRAVEGCLSIPTIRAPVERPQAITVAYTNLDGVVVEQRFTGWEARVIMHENDHINGVLFIDRLQEADRVKLKPALQHLEQRTL